MLLERLSAFTRRLLSVAFLHIFQASERITLLRLLVAQRGGAIASPGGRHPLVGAFVTDVRNGRTIIRRSVARLGATAVSLRVASGGEILVGRILIVVPLRWSLSLDDWSRSDHV